MKSILKALLNLLKRGGFAFVNYPVSMVFAICLAALSIWMIYTDPVTNLKLLVSLEWTFAFGAFLNTAACVIAKKSSDKKASFILANCFSLVISAGAFLMIYLPKGTNITEVSVTRILAGIAISLLVFLVVPTYRSTKIHFNEMVYMTVRSFFIAAVYALVIMLGSFFVAFAVQTLLYENMSGKVYSYIAILSGLFGYAFFLGSFPEFKKEEDRIDERVDKAIKQPKFAEILFQNIMIPIIAALTVVLFIWSIRILITRQWPDYNQIITIFTTYSLVGIFFYYLVSSYKTVIASFYKRIIPYTILVFLSFEAFTIINRIMLYGVKPMEYGIVFLWIFAVVASVLFIFIPVVKNRIPSYVAIVLIMIFVMPVIGAMDSSFYFQSKRLESILTRNEMINAGRIQPGNNVSLQDKKDITDATNYLFTQENKSPPSWLAYSLSSIDKFESVYGFAQEFYDPGRTPGIQASYLSIRTQSTPVSLAGYQFYIPRDMQQGDFVTSIETSNATYELSYTTNSFAIKNNTGTPSIIIKKGSKILLDGNLDEFAAQLLLKYPIGNNNSPQSDIQVPSLELSYEIKGDGVSIKLLYQVATFTVDTTGATTKYFELQGILFKES